MSKTTVRRINIIASLLEKGANVLVGGLELVIKDAATPKRVRRSRR